MTTEITSQLPPCPLPGCEAAYSELARAVLTAVRAHDEAVSGDE